MAETQCITPQHLVTKMRLRDVILRTFRDQLTRHELRQVVLSNFTFSPKDAGGYNVVIP